MKTIISSKGQLVLPAPLRERDRIAAGQTFDIERIEAGQYLLRRQPVPDNEGPRGLAAHLPGKGLVPARWL